jgi:transposase
MKDSGKNKPRRRGSAALLARRRQQFKRLPKGLSTSQIARRLKVSYQMAWYWARRLRYRTSSPAQQQRRKYLAKLRSLPPNLTVLDVARKFHVSRSIANSWIREAGYVPRRVYQPWNRKVAPEQWRQLNWYLPDIIISRMLQVSRERVRQVRMKLDMYNLPNRQARKRMASPYAKLMRPLRLAP